MIDYLKELLSGLLADLECYSFHKEMFSGDRFDTMKTSALRALVSNTKRQDKRVCKAYGHHRLYSAKLARDNFVYIGRGVDYTDTRIESIDIVESYIEAAKEYDEIRRALFVMNESGEMKKGKRRTNIVIK